MFLCIDIGNTRSKAAAFDAQGVLLETILLTEPEPVQLNQLIARHHIQHAITSATGKRNWDLSALNISGTNMALDSESRLPIKVVYATPQTLGRDRIAAACGAQATYPDHTCLIVDAGTCITMDILLKTGIYLGGNIAPGLEMRLKAMHEYTATLPKADRAWPELSFGDSTVHALQNGACLGALMEIEGIITRAQNAFGAVSIVMTGGDAAFLADRLESEIFVEPELVVNGLFKILSFNVQDIY